MNLVVKGLYIGSIKEALDKHLLESKGVKYILSVTDVDMPKYVYIKHKHISLPDDNVPLIKHFDEAFQFINEGIKAGGVLVHCTCGVSRSASFIIAYLMHERGFSYDKAYKLLFSKRPIVQPNIFFVYQLKEYEKAALAAYAQEKITKKDKEEEKALPQNYRYFCHKCRTLLFKNESLASHSKGKAACTSYFVEMQSWMKISTYADKGNIKCPNIKCGQKLGTYCWSGAQCTCGVWISPAFQLHQSKIDKIMFP